MRRVVRYPLLLLALAAPACKDVLVDGGTRPSTPANVGYALEPSGDPAQPLGILLFWDDVPDGDLAAYRVYSRGSTSGSFGLRGETSSNTFHDNGVPHLQYFVTAIDDAGNESGGSASESLPCWTSTCPRSLAFTVSGLSKVL